ncbi:MAG TPA: non-canonical purine NTP pyrophosphatase [Thermoplasmata archaeon]|nr:non-canonical purine NTP pyrophosphatase [Thermoplasmata archaeon]
MSRPVTVVTSNPHKYDEIRAVLESYGLAVRHISLRLREPQAESLEEVVREKLGAVPRRAGYVVVDDSGVFLRGLGGFPGVYSAYAYRTIGLAGVLRLVAGRDRRATFRTVAGVRSGSQVWLCTGEVKGTIAPRPRGRHGFGYDPIFIPRGERRTLAERTRSEKNRVSHRGRAFAKVARSILRLDKARTPARR